MKGENGESDGIASEKREVNMQKQIARASRFRCPKFAAERRARRRARQRKRSRLANAPFLDRFKSKLEALAASCRLCTNFELFIKYFMGCSACFTLEIICDIINQNKPVEK